MGKTMDAKGFWKKLFRGCFQAPMIYYITPKLKVWIKPLADGLRFMDIIGLL